MTNTDKNWASLVTLLMFGVLFCQSPLACAQANNTEDWESFGLMHLTVEPGEKISGALPIGAGADGIETFIPVTIFHGKNSGPPGC